MFSFLMLLGTKKMRTRNTNGGSPLLNSQKDCLFLVLFKPSMDEIMPTHIEEGICSVNSNGNSLTDTPRDDI